MRGARNADVSAFDIGGIIPACAGSTGHVCGVAVRLGDHPRMCGEHKARNAYVAADRGIIPACAGSTACRSPVIRLEWDHPRMCGEHIALWQCRLWQEGSSPHVRGAPAEQTSVCRTRWIIPACAGSTRRKLMDVCHAKDHPRMCGEHKGRSGIQGRHRGSSPHVRGAPLLSALPSRVRGIIPACAGSTGRRRSPRPSWRDHPRMCGEHDCCDVFED